MNLALKTLKIDDSKVVEIGDRANKKAVNLLKKNKSKNLTHIPNIGVIGEPNLLIPKAKKIFNYLKQAFIKAPIFLYFDLLSYI